MGKTIRRAVVSLVAVSALSVGGFARTNVTLGVDGTSYRRQVTIGSIANSDPLTVGANNTGGDWYSGDMDEVTYRIGS